MIMQKENDNVSFYLVYFQHKIKRQLHVENGCNMKSIDYLTIKLRRYYIFPISTYRWNYIVKNLYIGLYAGTQFQLQGMQPRHDIKSNVSGCTNPIKLTRISAVRNSLRLLKK